MRSCAGAHRRCFATASPGGLRQRKALSDGSSRPSRLSSPADLLRQALESLAVAKGNVGELQFASEETSERAVRFSRRGMADLVAMRDKLTKSEEAPTFQGGVSLTLLSAFLLLVMQP